jgi:hypothetical protein
MDKRAGRDAHQSTLPLEAWISENLQGIDVITVSRREKGEGWNCISKESATVHGSTVRLNSNSHFG